MHVGSRTRSPAVRLTESSKALSCVTNETRTRGSTEDLQLGQVRRGLKRKPDKSASLRIASARHADRVPVSRSADVGHLLVLLPLYSCRRMRVTDDTPQSASPTPRTWRSPRIDPIGSKRACSPR